MSDVMIEWKNVNPSTIAKDLNIDKQTVAEKMLQIVKDSKCQK